MFVTKKKYDDEVESRDAVMEDLIKLEEELVVMREQRDALTQDVKELIEENKSLERAIVALKIESAKPPELIQDTELTVPDQKKLERIKKMEVMKKIFKMMMYTIAIRALKAKDTHDLSFLDGCKATIGEMGTIIDKAGTAVENREKREELKKKNIERGAIKP